MAHSLTSCMRDQTAALLTDRLSVLDFQDWLVGATWDIEQHADPEAIDLTYTSNLALAELNRSDISQKAFRQSMRDAMAWGSQR